MLKNDKRLQLAILWGVFFKEEEIEANFSLWKVDFEIQSEPGKKYECQLSFLWNKNWIFFCAFWPFCEAYTRTDFINRK